VPLPPRVVILAAGASERLGEPKALVDLGGRTALAHLLDACGDPSPLVVAGAHSAEIALALGSRGELLQHPSWAEGRTGSVARAVAHLDRRDILLAPVDSPLVPAAVFDALRGAWAEAGAPSRGWLSPMDTASGKHGHPVLFGHELADQILSFDASEPLRSLRSLAEPLLELALSSPEVLDNLDTQAALALMRERL